MPIMAFLAAYLLLVIKTILGLALLGIVLVVWLLSIPGARRRERALAAEEGQLAALARKQRRQFGSPPPFRPEYSDLLGLVFGGGGMAIFLAVLVLKDAPAAWPAALILVGLPTMVLSLWWDDQKERARRERRAFYEAVIEANRRAY